MRVTCGLTTGWWIFKWPCQADWNIETHPDDHRLYRTVCGRGHKGPWLHKPLPPPAPPSPAPTRIDVRVNLELPEDYKARLGSLRERIQGGGF